jgi:hypothetical protein
MLASDATPSRQIKQKQGGQNKPQSCKHCGKFLIHTDGICDVYNVPSVHMASSGFRDMQNMSVIFRNKVFEDQEYMFSNDLSVIDDLTLENI